MGSTPSTPLPLNENRAQDRMHLKHAFLTQHNAPSDLRLSFLAGDCSFRTYDRLYTEHPWYAPSVVLMDAPPPLEDIVPFLTIQSLLSKAAIRVPTVYASNIENGFILLEDFGDLTYNRALQAGMSSFTLFQNALDVLMHVQKIHRPDTSRLFDVPLLVRELENLMNWGLPYQPSDTEKEQIRDLWGRELDVMTEINTVQPALTLRDYHVDNLMVLPGEGPSSCGVLDFQDALWGTKAYDLVSLLQDARFSVSIDLEKEMKAYFLKAQDRTFDSEMFHIAYTLLGVQRAIKIVGLCLRRARKDEKPHMLAHLPRLWNYLERGFAFSLTSELKKWFYDMYPKGLPYA